MSKTEITKRYILFIWGLFFAAIGVAFTKHGELGVSPISAVANVLSCKFSVFSFLTTREIHRKASESLPAACPAAWH